MRVDRCRRTEHTSRLDLVTGTACARFKDGYVSCLLCACTISTMGGAVKTIIALHGLIQNARAFDAIVPALVPHVRLIALDLRGRGGSDWRPVRLVSLDLLPQRLCAAFSRRSRFRGLRCLGVQWAEPWRCSTQWRTPVR